MKNLAFIFLFMNSLAISMAYEPRDSDSARILKRFIKNSDSISADLDAGIDNENSRNFKDAEENYKNALKYSDSRIIKGYANLLLKNLNEKMNKQQ